MSKHIARLAILATVVALAACTSPTSPTRSDCGGGMMGGTGTHC